VTASHKGYAVPIGGVVAYEDKISPSGVGYDKILGARAIEEVHNHYNFAWREEHDGRMLWVVRKGATPAFPGQRGFVDGSMGELSVIIESVENQWGAQSLRSTIHGGGRVMGRMEAKGKYGKTGEVKRAGKVTQQMMDEWVRQAGVTLRGAGVDESPHCYNRLPEVLAEHEGMIRVLHTLRATTRGHCAPECGDEQAGVNRSSAFARAKRQSFRVRCESRELLETEPAKRDALAKPVR